MVSSPAIGDHVLNGAYEVLAYVQAASEDKWIFLGRKGVCRYCGQSDPRQFRKVAHTFPEALGNKWVFSSDECDACNQLFSRYDAAIADSFAPLLTLGGVKGKGNQVRQTGRSAGSSISARRDANGHRAIMLAVQGVQRDQVLSVDPLDRTMHWVVPMPNVRFRPRDAYKALCKMGFALLPEEELPHYSLLKGWLLTPDDGVDFPCLEVGVSLGSVGNAPSLVSGLLLRRRNPTDRLYHILFLFCAGSVCFQVDLMSDHMEDNLDWAEMGTVKINWSCTIAGRPGTSPVVIDYGRVRHFNWASRELSPLPISTLGMDYDLNTHQGSLNLFMPSAAM